MPAPQNLYQPTTASPNSSQTLSGDVGKSIYSAVDAVVAMLDRSNLVKVDPAKLREVLDASKGRLSVGSWRAYGEKRAEVATESALSRLFPRVDDYGNVTAAIISISGSTDMTMNEYNVIVKRSWENCLMMPRP